MEVSFEHDIGDEVLVSAINVIAHVDMVSKDRMGCMYRCIYWNDSERREVWMYPWEIEARPRQTA